MYIIRGKPIVVGNSLFCRIFATVLNSGQRIVQTSVVLNDMYVRPSNLYLSSDPCIDNLHLHK